MHFEAMVERLRAILRSSKGRERRRWNVPDIRVGGRADAPNEFESIHLRHSQIDDHHVRLRVGEVLQRVRRRRHPPEAKKAALDRLEGSTKRTSIKRAK